MSYNTFRPVVPEKVGIAHDFEGFRLPVGLVDGKWWDKCVLAAGPYLMATAGPIDERYTVVPV